ncbi:GTP cyclohydrolase II RibA [Glaciimonas immobilis]|uniref:GTP cyclohydrolase-2 n=1 Tax=Glaciimonas immobilis TaxID=728004 RepID=A0A840RR50_9BURK|nr:GTP cyclohydrolase II RibA [Glaciimonas immobilis]KAF3999532.1 GTP cyclohydrolase II RibA [Glaciimonas immobilis]MBB5199070.1 GTP cyclohydrolase II [Glaciimonas immobilis]
MALKITRAKLPLKTGGHPEIATFYGLEGDDGRDHFALIFKSKDNFTGVPLIRIHSECITGDALGSLRCDCGEQLKEALRIFSETGGILLYLRQEGRGIGLRAKIEAYLLQETGVDTYSANALLGHPEDAREYNIAAQMLRALGILTVRLLTNNPEKIENLRKLGIEVSGQVLTTEHENPLNKAYLDAKHSRATAFIENNY